MIWFSVAAMIMSICAAILAWLTIESNRRTGALLDRYLAELDAERQPITAVLCRCGCHYAIRPDQKPSCPGCGKWNPENPTALHRGMGRIEP